MTSKHFTRRRKQEVLENPELVEDEELQKQVNEVKKKACRSVSECSSCIRFYSAHATYKEFLKKKNVRKLSKFDEMKKEIESTAWIQCDNLACRKWRRVPAAEIDDLAGKDWFCTLNNDPDFNSCLVPEEDTDKYDKMAQTVGLNYIKSEYWEGCLVWAKMPGYCSWPAVVTKSLETDDICHRDEQDNPLVYHVEYLGKTHTRGWIKRTALRIFSEGRNEEQTHTMTGCKKVKKATKTTFRKGETVEEALDEAIILSVLTPSQRLEKCIFKKLNYSNDDDAKLKTQKIKDAPVEKTLVILNNNIKSTENVAGTFKTPNLLEASVINNTQSNIGLVKKLPDIQDGKREQTAESKDVIFINEDLPASTIQFNYDNSLVNKTKEERYCLDVEMYTKNERAFEHDVLRFLMRNDILYKGLPKMQNAHVTLFQIYLAVHERGGYADVCKKRQWMSVAREVTNSHNVGSASNRIKSFYEKYLYPYELYIKGGDFTTYLKEHTSKKTVSRKRNRIPPVVDEVNNTVLSDKSEDNTGTGNSEMPNAADNFELLSECSVDIQEMLDNLVKDGSFCGLEDDVTAAKNKLGIDITFFDESPPIKEDVRTPSDFEEADLPVESAQEVPHLELLSNPMSDMESQEDLMHEMQALQNGMELINNVLDQL